MAKINIKGFFTKKRVIIGIVILLILALIVFFVTRRGQNTENNVSAAYSEATAQRSDLTQTIEASGTIEPYERYEITSLVRGEIISSPFEEGDMVQEGDLLYQIDDEDAQLSIEQTQNSIERAQLSQNNTNRDMAKLEIYANASGTISNFNLTAGQQVQAGEIATITNTGELTVNVPFTSADFDKISLGDSASVTSALYMTSLPGTVTHKYDSSVSTASDGSAVKNVEITVSNPGALTTGTSVGASVSTASGTVNSSGSGTLDNGQQTSVLAEVSGTVQAIYVKDGDYVENGQLLVKLSSETLENTQRENELSMRDSQLSLQSSQKALEDYQITSPISGTVITKTSKVGDKIDNTTASTVMMVVADMSRMKFTISVDELDISDLAVGQTAIVDADALPDETFQATVTSIANEGTVAGDGVTTYSVELTIDQPGNLRPGMNVNANIVVAEAQGVITIPEEALMSASGSTAKVMVKSADGASADSGRDSRAEGAPSGSMPEESGNVPATGETASGEADAGTGGGGMPSGGEMRDVEIGISDGTNVEIKSGLSEGEVVLYIPSQASSDSGMGMMMGGGMPAGGGGGMPSGGGAPGGGGASGGGGMPSGGGPR